MKYKLPYTCTQLYEHALYLMCVHISAIPRMPSIAYDHSWDDLNYSFQSNYSTDGTITFDMQHGMMVGVLRNHTSARIKEYPDKDALCFLEEANQDIRQLAEREALQYLLIRFQKKEKKKLFGSKIETYDIPVITTAFWSEGEDIYSQDDECTFIANGGEHIRDLCMSKQELIGFLIDDYELTEDELAFAEQLFNMKKENKMELSVEIYSNICNTDAKGYDEFISALTNFHFVVVS